MESTAKRASEISFIIGIENIKDMNKHLLKYFTFCLIALLSISCNDSESDLLEHKVFFENKEFILEVEGQESLTYDLQARLSALHSSSVEVSYIIADSSVVEEYNKRHSKKYEIFKTSNANLSSSSSTISVGDIYSEKSVLTLSNLKDVEDGKSYMLPIRIKSSSLPVIDGSDIIYIIINKPVRIMKVGKFQSNYVKVPWVNKFQSLTYEALIYIDRLGDNNTVMGCEGVLILRIGDSALPGKANNLIQIAGNKQFHASTIFEPKKWYHVAFSYDQPSGKAVIYINGEKAAESTWDTPSFDLTSDGGGFFIGKVAGFMWGERPFYGYMSEVRIWNTSRTENQIKQNMLNIDPETAGLAAYYKFNGEDQYQEGSNWFVKDASGNNMNGSANGGNRAIDIVDLEEPVSIK